MKRSNNSNRTMTLRSWYHHINYNADFDSPAFRAYLNDPEALMKQATTVLKHDDSSTVVMTHLEQFPVVIKRANSRHFWQGLRRSIARSRASKNWQNTAILQDAEIPTFTPIAMIEKRWGPFRLGSYFICSYIKAPSALHFFKDTQFMGQWPSIIERISALCAALAHEGISHRDLNLSNILIADDQAYLIDLESMRRYRWQFWAKRSVERCHAKLLKNWAEAPGVLAESLALYRKSFNQINFSTI